MKKELTESQEFKKWIDGRVVLIHDVYDDYSTFIVIHTSGMGKFNITRFFKSQNKFHVSKDYENKTSEEIFEILLKRYSSSLK